jgi:hypothetical protein
VDTERNKIYDDVVTALYATLKEAHEADELSYFEIVGILEKLKEHFVLNTTVNITDIMIKRQIRLSNEQS